MSAGDLPQVRAWLVVPHVARWWPDADEQAGSIAEHLSDTAMQCLILTMDDADVGYLQVYAPHHAPRLASDDSAIAHPYRDQPSGTRGLFIGEASRVGRGHGPRLVGQIVRGLFEQGSPCVVTDPDPANTHSVTAFRKAGFRQLGTRDTAWGHVLLMRCDNPGME